MPNKSIIYYPIVFLISTTSFAISLPNETSGNHNEYCKQEWSKRGVLDTHMYEYCMEREHEAYLNFISKSNQYKDFNWIQSAANFVIENNTKRGLRDDTQVNYQLEMITEGFEDIKYTMTQQGYNQLKMESCYSHWGVQWNMVYYCYKN